MSKEVKNNNVNKDASDCFQISANTLSMMDKSVENLKKEIDDIEKALDEADTFAENNSERMSHNEVFDKLRNGI